VQTWGIDPVIGTDEGVLAPGRVIGGRQSGALEVIEAVHRQHQPLFPFADQAIKQVNIGYFVRLEAAHRVEFRRGGLEERFLFVVFFKFSAQLGNGLIKLVCRSVDIPGHIAVGHLLHGLQRNLFVELGDSGCSGTHSNPLLALLTPALPPALDGLVEAHIFFTFKG
jgi:hypothetical protein